MARNGSGTYTAPANSVNPAVDATTIDSSDFNTLVDDLETALTESIARDGQTTTTAAIPFASGITSDTIAEKTSNTGVTIDGTLVKDGTINSTQVNDTNGNEVLILSPTASAVNELTLANAATGNAPIIRTTGEVDTGLQFQNSDSEETLILASVATAVNEVTITNAATGNAPSLTATGETNIDLNLVSAGTGNVQVNGTDVFAGPILAASQATTSGTAKDFTSIPAWVTEIKVVFAGVSMDGGTDDILIQIGTGGSPTTTGYTSNSNQLDGIGGSAITTSTNGFVLFNTATGQANSGHMILTHLGSNIWVASHTVYQSSTLVAMGGGFVTLAGVLDNVRVTRDGSTDSFDAGNVTILYD